MSLSFTNTGAQFAQTFSATENGYVGAIAQTNTCAPNSGTIATVTPTAAAGPSATFTVTPQAAGTCSIAVRDTLGQSATVNVTVTPTTIIIQSRRT